MGSPASHAYLCVYVCESVRVFKCFYNPTVSIRLETDGTAVSYSSAAADWAGRPPAYGDTIHYNIIFFCLLGGGVSSVKRKHIFMCCLLFKTVFKFHPWEPVKEEICSRCVCQWVLLHGFLGGRASCGFRYGLLSASIRRLYFCLPPRTLSRRTPEKQRQKKSASIHSDVAAKQNICQHEGNNKQK